jgi:hypothetical protein
MSAPGFAHQTLLLWAARRMFADGFVVAGFDSTAAQGGFWNGLPQPFQLKGRRPDAWGARPDRALLAFAEAKTANDINTRHTVAQLRIFGAVRMKGGTTHCPLYIAVSRAEAARLDKVLIETRLLGVSHIVRLHVPEILLGEASHAA